MKILSFLRPENTGLAIALMQRGHELWVAPNELMLMLRRIGYPAQPLVDQEPAPVPKVDGIAEEAVQNGWTGVSQAVREVLALHKAEGLDAVLVWTDATPIQRAAVLAAKHVGVPTFEITHGALNTYRQGHFECESHVDYIIAPGQEEADFRRFYGQSATVLIAGKPSFDWIFNDDNPGKRASVREQLGIPPKRPVLLYGMTWRHPFSTWERDADLGEATIVNAHMNLQPVCRPFLIIKPHYARASKKNVQEIAGWCEANGITDYAVTGMDVQVLLPAADLVVSHKSSLLVEAVLMGLPAVGFDFRERNDFAFYEGLGVEWVAKRELLIPALASCLLDRDTRNRLAMERQRGSVYFNHICDGRATERAVDAIEQAVAGTLAA